MTPFSIAGSMPDITNQSPPPPTLKLGWDLRILFNTVPCVFTTNWIWAVQNETYFPFWDISRGQHEVGTQKIFIRWTETNFFLVPTTSPAKSWLIGKDPDAGRDWGQEEKGTTEDEMAGWYHRLNAHEFGWTPALVMDKEAWHAEIHGLAKSQTRLSDWTELNMPDSVVSTSKQWTKQSSWPQFKVWGRQAISK